MLRFVRALAACSLVATLTLPSNGQVSGWKLMIPAAGLTVGFNPLNPDVVYAESSAGSIVVSRDRGATWNAWSTVPISLLREILVHPNDTNTVFVASSGDALYRTTNNGGSWHVSIPGFGIDGESVCYDPVHPDTMFAGNFSDGKVFRSTNRGNSWTQMGISGTNLCALSVRADSVNIICAGTGSGTISLSTDFGSTWRVVKSGAGGAVFQEVPKIMMHPLNPMIGYATTYGGIHPTTDIWKTTNGGWSWFQSGLQEVPTWAMEIHPSDPNILYAGTFDVMNPVVYASTNGGSSWTAVSAGLPVGGSLWSLKVHPLDPSLVIVSVTKGAFGFGGIYRKADSRAAIQGYLIDSATGDTIRNGKITNLSTNDVRTISSSSPGYGVGFFEGDSILTPVFRVEAYPYATSEIPLSFVPDSTVQLDILLQKLQTASLTGLLRDSMTLTPAQGNLRLSVSRSIGDTVLSETTDASGNFSFNNLYVSDPYVNTYTQVEVEPDIPYATTYLSPGTLTGSGISLTVDLRNGDVLVVAAADSGRYLNYYVAVLESLGLRSNRWDLARRGVPSLRRTTEFSSKTAIYYLANKSTSLAASELDSLVASLDAGVNLFLTGQNVAERNATSSLFANYLQMGFGGNTNVAICNGVSGDIFTGSSFFTQGSSANNQTSRDILTILDSRVKPLLDYGSGSGNRAALRNDSVGAGGRAIVMGFGFEAIHTFAKRYAVMQTVMNYFGAITSVDFENTYTKPLTFALEQNYPNPFNAVTRFRFSTLHFGLVTLKIYDILGREVATIVDDELQPGVHETEWNAGPAASGVYYVRLSSKATQSSEQVQATRKLILLR